MWTHDNKIQRALALRGFVRLIGADSDRPEEETISMYSQAIELASNAGERKMVLSALAKRKSFAALEMAAAYLEDSCLQAEAEAAVVKIAAATLDSHPCRTEAFLQKALETSKNDSLRQQAEKMIGRIKESEEKATGFVPLFNGKDLTGWTVKPGSWAAEAGVLTRRGGGDIWTEDTYGDFILDLEFKLAEGANSGVFLRTADITRFVQTGIEVQIHTTTDGHSIHGACGAIYDCLSPRVNCVKKPGEWNRYIITCRTNRVSVVLNDRQIIDMDLNLWAEPYKNPDGTPNKFGTALKDMPRAGHIGLQDHGDPVWFRNIRIKPLDK